MGPPCAAQIELAQDADAPAFAAVHRACFADFWDTTVFSWLLAEPSTVAFAARRDGRVVGVLLCRSLADEAEVLTLAVEPKERRQRFALRMLQQGLGELRRRGALRLVLEVAQDNLPALALYAGLGLAPVGRRPGYYLRPPGPAVDALILAGPL